MFHKHPKFKDISVFVHFPKTNGLNPKSLRTKWIGKQRNPFSVLCGHETDRKHGFVFHTKQKNKTQPSSQQKQTTQPHSPQHTTINPDREFEEDILGMKGLNMTVHVIHWNWTSQHQSKDRNDEGKSQQIESKRNHTRTETNLDGTGNHTVCFQNHLEMNGKEQQKHHSWSSRTQNGNPLASQEITTTTPNPSNTTILDNHQELSKRPRHIKHQMNGKDLPKRKRICSQCR